MIEFENLPCEGFLGFDNASGCDSSDSHVMLQARASFDILNELDLEVRVVQHFFNGSQDPLRADFHVLEVVLVGHPLQLGVAVR